jgi:16S rRNA (cytosine967-C5)-methyltransferase
MPVSPARAAAFDILLQVEQKAAYASELLHAPRYRGLSTSDHGLATELVMGVLRWQSLLDRSIAEHSSQPLRKLDPQVLIALRLAVYQLMFLDRIPHRAAVHESIELVKRARKRSAAPFANAVLRKVANVSQPYSAGGIEKSQTAFELSEASAHPLWMVERWMQNYGLSATRLICLHNQQPPETAVRLTDPALESELKNSGVTLSPGRLLGSARRVIAGDVTDTPAFREGRVFVQDEASQLVAILLGSGKNILDCCAAPGGKTRIMADRSPTARILAAEIHPHRARLLRRLVPAQNVEVVTADIQDLPADHAFDGVLADVPCSGTGTLARNPESKWRLKPEDMADLSHRQHAILKSAMAQVSSGGRLVYSTCSLEREENEAIVEAALAEQIDFKLIPAEEELALLRSKGELAWPKSQDLVSGPYLRTLPGTHPCDGFFAAVLKRD